MNSLIFLVLYFLTLIMITYQLNCVSCVGSANTGCNDPYNENTSGDIPVPFNNYCAKVKYSTYVERMAGGRSCTPGFGNGDSTVYCCSDKDYCNGTTMHASSMIEIVALMIASIINKEII